MRRLIGFTGKPDSGKSVCAKYLSEKYGLPHINVGDTIKDMLAGLYYRSGLSSHEVDRRLFGDLKELPDPYLNGKSPRYALQTLGKEWRDLISVTLFADRWEDRIKNAHGAVADGMRYADEYVPFKRQGGFLIHVIRPGTRADNGHIAEKLHLRPDATLVNDAGLEDLYAKLEKLLEVQDAAA